MNPENPEHASNSSGDGPKNRNGGGGGYMGQPSAGLLAGLALGVLAALLIWWKGR